MPPDALISSTANGVLITHFWYMNYLNPRRTQVTATTLDGTFAIKDGKLDHPITNMRATPPLLEMFANVEAIASERVVYPQFNSVMLVPGMKINNFSLSEDTENG
jgi:predicted Zn-dependent protease